MSLKLVLALPSVEFRHRRKQLPDAPGLYFVVRDDAEVMYVGMSRKSIQRRWKMEHHAVYDVENSGLSERVKIAYLVYDGDDGILEGELAAIHEFRPPWNSGHVPRAALERLSHDA